MSPSTQLSHDIEHFTGPDGEIFILCQQGAHAVNLNREEQSFIFCALGYLGRTADETRYSLMRAQGRVRPLIFAPAIRQVGGYIMSQHHACQGGHGHGHELAHWNYVTSENPRIIAAVQQYESQ